MCLWGSYPEASLHSLGWRRSHTHRRALSPQVSRPASPEDQHPDGSGSSPPPLFSAGWSCIPLRGW